MLELYLAEECPYCVKVRRHLQTYGIAYTIKPITLGKPTPFSEELRKLGGKIQVPFLVDPQRNVKMYESSDIVAYITEQYVRTE